MAARTYHDRRLTLSRISAPGSNACAHRYLRWVIRNGLAIEVLIGLVPCGIGGCRQCVLVGRLPIWRERYPCLLERFHHRHPARLASLKRGAVSGALVLHRPDQDRPRDNGTFDSRARTGVRASAGTRSWLPRSRPTSVVTRQS